LFEAPHLGSDLALDLRGSPVEGAVWKALQAIPPGETRTYGTIAKTLPMAATAQDVGAACAANSTRSPCPAIAS
jgi:AraC family transcriptional regulator of adaptative response/methylated-DNA-[protein]-cysteine methyltransferase